ncbi:MAG: serine protein kinase, partial [Acidobacteriota bacterium]
MIGRLQDLRGFKDQHWEGSFEDYLQIVRHNTKVTRTAFQRMYDMILSKGTRAYYEYKKRIIHYNFFDDKDRGGVDAIFGLDIPLMKLVNVFKSAAQHYGTEKRVLLLHGPVGSSKSTIVRLLKKGLEEYSRTPEGALYTFTWVLPAEIGRKKSDQSEVLPCPMHEEPLHLVLEGLRPEVLRMLNEGRPEGERVLIEGDLCPACRQNYKELNLRYGGAWPKIV